MLIICLFAISSVSATDANDQVSLNDENSEIVGSNQINEDLNDENNEIIAVSQNDDSALNDGSDESLSMVASDESNEDGSDISNEEVLGMSDDWYENYYYEYVDPDYETDVKKATASISVNKVSTTYGSGKDLQIKVLNAKTKKPIIGAELSLKVYTGSKYKTVSLTTNSKGIAKYAASNLSVGTHKIVVNLKKSEYISASSQTTLVRVSKATAILKPTKLKTSYGSGKFFKIKVTNSKTKKAMKGVALSLKVYTGKKTKVVTVKTNSKGIAQYAASYLDVGKHKIIVSMKKSKDASAKSKTSSVKITKATFVISAPKVTNTLKSGTFKVTVKNKATKKGVKGVKVKIKVYTGTKYKTFTAKTDSKGIASISTKSLGKGDHKVKVSIKATSNFKAASKSSNIKVTSKVKTYFGFHGYRYTYTANGSPSTIYAGIDLYDEKGNVLRKTISAEMVDIDIEGDYWYDEYTTYTSGEEVAIPRRWEGFTINGYPPKETYMLITFKGDRTYEGSTYKILLS